MTHEEILAKWESMTPRERDVWVAEKIMGYEESRMKDGFVRKGSYATLPRPYSTDIAAAFETWEHDRPNDWVMDLHWSNGKYIAEIIQENHEEGHRYLAQVESQSAAEAMVKCRLLVVIGE